MNYTRELDLARAAAEEAGAIQQSAHLAADMIERKSDDSPVTAIDRQCEEAIRNKLQAGFPGDGVLGEECGDTPGASGRRWIVDPLDGTRPFIRGIPTYSSLIALEDDGQPVVGVIHLPALGETYWAARGLGAFLNGVPIRVSSTRRIEEVTGSSLGYVERREEPISSRLLDFMAQWDYAYGFMDNYSYGAVAAGKLDLCVNLLDKPWDCAAAACIVAEAGGKYTDLDGTATVHSGNIVLSNGHLHEQVLAALR